MINPIKHSGPLLFLFGLIYFAPTQKFVKSEKPIIKTIKKVDYFIGPDDKVLKRKKAFSSFQYDIHEYNDQGNILRHDSYDKNGNLKNRYLYKYNEHGDQIELVSMSSKTGIRTYGRSEYVYNEKNEIKVKHYESGNQYKSKKSVSKTEFFYRAGNLVKKVTEEIWMGKKSKTTMVFEYNELNKIISSVQHIEDKYLYQKMNYIYNEGVLFESHRTTYPKGGNPEYFKEHKKYDGKGNIIESIQESGNGHYTKELFEYNHENLKSKYQKYEQDDEIVIDEYYEYKYDKNGNWITLIKKFPNSKNVGVTEREIEYHK